MTEKVTGYALLVVGLLIIFYSAINIYSVFTKKSKPVQLFNLPGISLDVGGGLGGIELPPEAEQLGIKLPEQSQTKQQIISPDLINDSSNLFAHVIFMGFISSIGFKIAQIGATILKPLKITLKDSSVLEQVRKEVKLEQAPPKPKSEVK